jgi:predicted transposase/invertase (TIGR01784 family)
MSKSFANIHDSFFKKTLRDPELAGRFLREHLPPDIADLLGSDPPEQVPGSFVDEDLRQHHSDLLFRVHLKAGRDAFAYVLMEHKSSPDPGARLQLLRYVVRVLSDCYEQSKRRLPLPPVLPLLAHQGPEGWTISCDFADLFGDVPDPLRLYLPSFRHALVDLTRLDDQHLSVDVRLRAFLKTLKYSRRDDLPACIDIVLAEVPVLGKRDLLVILNYLNKGPIALNSKVMHDALVRIVPERKEQIMGWFSQPYYEQGIVEGEARGEAKVLALLLERRFGGLPASVRERIFAADVGSIEGWVKRVFDAPDLESVFGAN